MKQLKTFIRLPAFLPAILFVLLISSLASRASDGNKFGSDNTLDKPGIELAFSYPEQVNAGDDFTFTIQVKKDAKYFIPGMISCKFFGGPMPKSVSIESVNISIENNTVYLEWDKLSSSNIISFSIPVSTGKNMQGVYPVKVDYIDDFGFRISDNVGVYVHNKTEAPLELIIDTKINNPYSISLNYPEAISFDSLYPVNINVAKGKNTGKANIFVQLPPKSKLVTIDFDNYVFDVEKGNLLIKIESMPPGPDFDIHCMIQNTTKMQAVYPLRASVEFENNTEVYFNDFILVSDQPLLNPQNAAKTEGEIAGETSNTDMGKVDDMFSELDKLLDVWTKSTNVTAENQSDSIFKIETAQPSIAQDKIVFYSVQIIASAIEMPKAEAEIKELGITENLLEDYDGNIYRYTVGVFNTIEEAENLKIKLGGLGYPDAFVVEYEDGIRVKSFY